jgi:hypothetical protein
MNKKITTPENERDMDSLKEEFSKLFQEWDTKLKDVNLDDIEKYMGIWTDFMEGDGWVPERDGRTMEDMENDYKEEMKDRGDEDCDEGLEKDN